MERDGVLRLGVIVTRMHNVMKPGRGKYTYENNKKIKEKKVEV